MKTGRELEFSAIQTRVYILPLRNENNGDINLLRLIEYNVYILPLRNENTWGLLKSRNKDLFISYL